MSPMMSPMSHDDYRPQDPRPHDPGQRDLNEPEYFFDKPANVTLVLRVFYGLCALLLLLDLLLHRHVENEFERILAFYPIYGFAACVLLVMIAKQMRHFLMRDEDYYRRGQPETVADLSICPERS